MYGFFDSFDDDCHRNIDTMLNYKTNYFDGSANIYVNLYSSRTPRIVLITGYDNKFRRLYLFQASSRSDITKGSGLYLQNYLQIEIP